MASRTPLYLSAAAVKACLPAVEVYEVVTQTLRDLTTGGVVKGPKTGFGVDVNGEHLHMGSVCGYVRSGPVAGIKWFTVSSKNPSRNLPRCPTPILVCDGQTGLLDGVLDGTQLTSDRTAAMAIVAASACSKRPLRQAAVVGAGAVGHALVKFLATIETVDRIAVASQRETSARHACDAGAASPRREVRFLATSDVQRAVHDADVVFTATGLSKDSDLVRAAWLKQDAIVCSLGSCREVDLELISQAWIVVDDPDGVKLRRSDFREGGAGYDRIAGDTGSVLSGQLHLPQELTRIHLILVGLGVLDVALGARAIQNARLMGLGVPLE
ncbi:NAD(P)-binding domain-containing protein [Bradyrhizobium sp. DASA03076]|uniref:NAD(P)-binding domain-containing protein n=1 Tax=Bradyrhizobium sp. BLXBL-03 TaxID=3395916 RepID=UPI003F6F1B32